MADKKPTKAELVKKILETEGFEDAVELANDYEWGSRRGVPAICARCNYIEDMEPDCIREKCPECNAYSFYGLYFLMGIDI